MASEATPETQHFWNRSPFRFLMPLRWRLILDLRRLEQFYKPYLAEAENKGRTEFESALSEYFMERDLIQEPIDELDTNRLLRTARRLYLEVPDRPRGKDVENDHWTRGHVTGAWLLKDAGVRHVRRLVRAEQKELREARLGWWPPLTGAIGALTGLLAVLLNHC